MAEQRVRVGIVGAGQNTRVRHVPGFRSLSGVELAGVVNQSAESSARAAAEFGIGRVFPDWQSLVSDPQIDAVLIGTWPNMHAEITCAALAAGKHVLTEARMARNLEEARRMHAAATAHPELTTQIVPSPLGLVHDAFVRQLIEQGYLGDLREVIVLGADDLFWDYSVPLHWRQDRNLSGKNVLSMGILHETLSRWVPETTQVFAQSKLFEPTRPAPRDQGTVPVTVPDSVQIVTQLEGGARGIYHISGTILFGPGKQIHLYGSSGTIKLEFGAEEKLSVGRAGDSTMRVIELSSEKRGRWRVEEEFIQAIRGHEKVRYTTFGAGFKYMEFTEAVALSTQSNQPVPLPLGPPEAT